MEMIAVSMKMSMEVKMGIEMMIVVEMSGAYEDEHEENEDDRGEYEYEHECNRDKDGGGIDSGDYEVEQEGNGDKGGRGDDNGEYGNPTGDGEGHDSDYSSSEEPDKKNYVEDEITIDCLTDILKIDMKNISIDDGSRYDFFDLEIAHQFYCWYARMNGFFAHKIKVVIGKARVKSCNKHLFVQTNDT
jgi:hypothetical protein